MSDKLDISVKNVFWTILKGLDYLHTTNWAHWDIKPDNICYNSAKGALLCDFTTIINVEPEKKYT